MERRVVSLWLPRFATDRLTRRRDASRPGWRSEPASAEGPPLATVTAAQGGLRIAAATPAARAAGVVPGLPLADARALVPGLRTAEADPAGDGRALAALADWCGRYTPWTAVNGGDGVWLDISGCAHLFGGETALLEDLGGRLDGLGFHGLAAAADTPGAAWAVARFAGRGTGAATVVPPGKTRRALVALPVAGLRLPPATVEGLNRVGLRRIGDLLGLPRAPLAARFGETVVRRLDEALGRSDEPISPRRPTPPLRARLAFAEPIGRAEDIGAAARRLLEDLCARLERAHRGARRLELALYRVDGTVARAHIGTGRPTRDAHHLERLFTEKLEGLDSGFGVEVMVLAATAADPLAPVQGALHTGRGMADTAGAGDGDGVARLVDRLGNRLGRERVVRLVPRASHVPERACREVSALAPPAPAGAGSAGSPRSRRPGKADGAQDSETAGGRPAQPRPLHLLPWPEPIEVMAPVPDHPPVMFRWRRHRHRVACADGPERIGPEWWLEEPADAFSPQHRIRDYYRVEDTEGRRFWLYREGLYRPGVEPAWYLHGFFA